MTDTEAGRALLAQIRKADKGFARFWNSDDGEVDPLVDAMNALRDHPAKIIAAIEREAAQQAIKGAIQQMADGNLPGATDQEKAGIQYAAIWLGSILAEPSE